MIGTLATDGFLGGLLHMIQRRGDWAGPHCTKCNSPAIKIHKIRHVHVAVDAWDVTFGTARPRLVASSLYQM